MSLSRDRSELVTGKATNWQVIYSVPTAALTIAGSTFEYKDEWYFPGVSESFSKRLDTDIKVEMVIPNAFYSCNPSETALNFIEVRYEYSEDNGGTWSNYGRNVGIGHSDGSAIRMSPYHETLYFNGLTTASFRLRVAVRKVYAGTAGTAYFPSTNSTSTGISSGSYPSGLLDTYADADGVFRFAITCKITEINREG